MKNPLEYYKIHFKIYQAEAKRLYKQMTALSTLRLFVFLATCFGVYFFFQQWQIAVPIGVFGVVVFIYLLSKYTDIKRQREFNKALVDINNDEIKIASGDFQDRDEGLQFQDPTHFYSLDIDLFGRGSFFQFINRTTINEGTNHLVNALKANHIDGIESRQDAIKELSSKPKWRQYYSATSSLVDVETPAKQVVIWLQNHKIFLPKIMSWLPMAFGLASIALFVLILLGIITNQALIGYWLLLGLGITGRYLKKINVLASNTDKVRDTFRQYATLLDLIENETFSSELLQQKQKQIQSGDKKASDIFKAFSKSLDALDNRNNLIGAIFGNGYFLTDIKHSYQIEQWIEQYANKVSDWFEAVSFFDAYNSLGNYAYNHPEFIFPEIINDGSVIKAEHLGHPLLNKEKRVDSNLTIKNEQFFIVTGANNRTQYGWKKHLFKNRVFTYCYGKCWLANMCKKEPIFASKTNYQYAYYRFVD